MIRQPVLFAGCQSAGMRIPVLLGAEAAQCWGDGVKGAALEICGIDGCAMGYDLSTACFPSHERFVYRCVSLPAFREDMRIRPFGVGAVGRQDEEFIPIPFMWHRHLKVRRRTDESVRRPADTANAENALRSVAIGDEVRQVGS